MIIRKLVSCAALAVIVVGLVTLVAPSSAEAKPPVRCTIEVGGPQCPPCTVWDSHRCCCVKIPGCTF